MSTETRIGIVAGLLIVVVASVYFFYGNSRRNDDILVAASPKPAETVKIPVGSDKKPARAKPLVMSPSAGRAQPSRPPQVMTHQPPKPVVQSPAAPAKSEPVALVGPQAGQVSSLNGVDKYRLTVPPASSDSSAQTNPPLSPAITPFLRSGPSPSLVDATKENLKPSDAPSGGSPAMPPSASANKPSQTGLVDSTPTRVKLEPETLAKPASGEMANSDAWPKKHVVAKGDSLGSLARQYYQDAKKTGGIIAANPSLKARSRLKPGEIVTIPQPVGELVEHSATPTASMKTYSVQEGDTLYAIAKKSLGSSERWREIFELNKDQLRGDPRRLKPGMALRLPSE